MLGQIEMDAPLYSRPDGRHPVPRGSEGGLAHNTVFGRSSGYMLETPFDNIESAQEYMTLLAQAVEEAIASIEEECAVAVSEKATRREQALRMVAFKLTKLNGHLKESHRILNDLRTLRRLLLAERRKGAHDVEEKAAAPPGRTTGDLE